MSDKIYSIQAGKGGNEVFGFASMESYNRLWWLASEYECRSLIEVGSFLGMTSIFLLDNSSIETVFCIDLFDNPHQDKYRGIGVQIKHPNHEYYGGNQYREFLRNTLPYVNIRHVKMPSLEAAELDIEADMVYIDANHTEEAVVADIKAWAPHARKVLCGDDNYSHKFGVKAAIKSMGIPDSEERIWWLAGEELREWKR